MPQWKWGYQCHQASGGTFPDQKTRTKSFMTSSPCKLLTSFWDGHGSMIRKLSMMVLPTNISSCITTRRWRLSLTHLSRCMKTSCDCSKSMSESWLKSHPNLRQSLRHRPRRHPPPEHLAKWTSDLACLPRTGKFANYFCPNKLSMSYIAKKWFYSLMTHSITYLLKSLLCCRNLRTFFQMRSQVDYHHSEGSSTDRFRPWRILAK